MSELSNNHKENIEKFRIEPSLMSIFNKNKKIYKTRLIEKEIRKSTRYERLTIRPQAPHNTTQFLTHKEKVNDSDSKSMDKNWHKGFKIDNFIITGGSMKGIIHNLILFN